MEPAYTALSRSAAVVPVRQQCRCSKQIKKDERHFALELERVGDSGFGSFSEYFLLSSDGRDGGHAADNETLA